MVSPQIAPTKAQWRPPIGTIYAYDPSPLNWLFITWNTMEEPIRVDQDGRVVNALATGARWPDDHTLELDLRTGVRFQDGEPFTAHNIDRKSTRLNSSHGYISYAVFCLKKKKEIDMDRMDPDCRYPI